MIGHAKQRGKLHLASQIPTSYQKVSQILLTSYVSVSYRRREIAFMKICSLIVIVFIVCNLPRLGIGLFEISRYLGRTKPVEHPCSFCPPGQFFWLDDILVLALFY